MGCYTWCMSKKNVFRSIANKISGWAGSAPVFIGAIIVVLIWASSGPFFDFSDTWQLVINTGTTIVTFLMVFLIQNTQNRDTKAIQLKLDELIHSTKGARDQFVGLEDLTDEDLAELDREFKKLADDPKSIKALAALRAKVASEHARRHSLRETSEAVLNTLLLPITLPTNEARKALEHITRKK